MEHYYERSYRFSERDECSKHRPLYSLFTSLVIFGETVYAKVCPLCDTRSIYIIQNFNNEFRAHMNFNKSKYVENV